jgi:hypothetical protein
MKTQQINTENLSGIHQILIDRDIDYELVNVLNEFPGECLIQVKSEYMRKRAVHSLLGKEYFLISTTDASSLLRILLIRIKDLKDFEDDTASITKGAAGIILFLAQANFGLVEGKDFDLSTSLSDISSATKVLEIRFKDSGVAEKLYKQIEFLRFKHFLHIILVENAIHFVIDPGMARRIDANTRNRYKEIIDYLQTTGSYLFVLPNTGFAKNYLRLNLGSSEKINSLLPTIHQKFFRYSFDVNGKILTVAEVGTVAYKELFIRDPKAFSATTFLSNFSAKLPTIEEALDLLYANTFVEYTKKRPKNRKNNMYAGFANPEDAMLGAKVLTSGGYIAYWKEGSCTLTIPVSDEFGLWKEDSSNNSTKLRIEKKFNGSREGY